MSYMRGKFYSWGSRDSITIMHGRDITEDDFVPPDPEWLLTGQDEPTSVSLPYEVAYILAARIALDYLCDNPDMTLEQLSELSTRWEAWRDCTMGTEWGEKPWYLTLDEIGRAHV